MKKWFIGIIGLSLLLVAAGAFARTCDSGRNSGTASAEQKQFFDATREMRKEMHDKRFQLMESVRAGQEQAKIDALENEIDALRTKIQAKAQEFGISNGTGGCANGGSNCGMGQNAGNGKGCNGGACGNQQANAGCAKKGRCAE